MRLLILVALLSVVAGSAACTRSVADETVTGVRPMSEPMPEISGEDLQGHSISTSDLAGHVYVVNVWATWCTPCEREQPALVDVAKRYERDGVAFLGINHMDQVAKAEDWVRAYDVPYPSVSDQSGRFAASLGYIGLPDTYVVDATGTIRYGIAGATDADQLGGLLDQLLAAQTSASSATATNSPAR